MNDYLTADARAIAIGGYEHAIRLGHRYLGGEHFLLVLASADEPAGAVLRERGLAPERVEEEIVRLSAAGLLGNLDRDALATIGIDVDAVRVSIEASFGPEALVRAAQAAHEEPGRFSMRPRSGAERDGLFLPHTPEIGQILHNAGREARARHGTQPGVEHLALALIAADQGMVPRLLSALGVSAPALRASVLERYRRAS